MRLSHDRWYSRAGSRQRQGRAQHESSAIRKVIGLGLVLAMVMVAMRQLSDPSCYEPAFQAIGLTHPSQSPQSTIADAASNEGTTTSKAAPSHSTNPLVAAMFTPASDHEILWQQMWGKLLEKQPVELIEWLSEVSQAPVATQKPPPPAFAGWLRDMHERIASWKDIYQDQTQGDPDAAGSASDETRLGLAFIEQWLLWAELMQREIQSASAALEPGMQQALEAAIDQNLLERINDGTPWRPVERAALNRSLKKAVAIQGWTEELQAGVSPNQLVRLGPFVEWLSLMKQPKEFRGKIVRFRGSIASVPVRVKPSRVSPTEFSYDEIWLKPERGSQPMVVYHLAAFPPLEGWPNQKSATEEGQLYEFTGLVLKKLAYPSHGGVDVAPLLITFDARKTSAVDSRASVNFVAAPFLGAENVWREPNELERQVGLVRDILSNSLDQLVEPETAQGLIEEQTVNIAALAWPSLAQVVYQLPRLSGTLDDLIPSRRSLGSGNLGACQGFVTRVERIEPPKANAKTAIQIPLYRLHLEIGDRDISKIPPTKSNNASIDQTVQPLQKIVVFASEVPKAWQKETSLYQPIEVKGISLNINAASGPQIWLASKIRWTWPSGLASLQESISNLKGFSRSLKPSLNSDWLRLASLGFDLAQAESVFALNKQPITAKDSDGLYPLLSVASRWPASAAAKSVDDQPPGIDVIETLNPKLEQTFRLIKAKVYLIRATKILVKDERAAKKLGGSAYYELDSLMNLDGKLVRLDYGDQETDFQGEFPITLVARELPDWLEPPTGSAKPSSESIDDHAQLLSLRPEVQVWYPKQAVEIEGLFYRLWSYSTAQTREASNLPSQAASNKRKIRQIAPLVAVVAWRSIPTEIPRSSDSWVWSVTTAAVIVTGIIYCYFRWQPAKKSTRRPSLRADPKTQNP